MSTILLLVTGDLRMEYDHSEILFSDNLRASSTTYTFHKLNYIKPDQTADVQYETLNSTNYLLPRRYSDRVAI